ncbi:hypothetical protein HanIR_Chr06g0256641 [Helianthus annuus]|nr:hypothetical protein HanIR_Chr06g0256641 [Helianthus annuus]
MVPTTEVRTAVATVDRNYGRRLDSDSNTISGSSADTWFLFRVAIRGLNLIWFWFEYFKWVSGWLGARLGSTLVRITFIGF